MIGTVVHGKTVPRVDREIIERIASIGTATVHEAQGRTGDFLPYMRPITQFDPVTACKSLDKPWHIAGSAITCQIQPGDNWMLHVAVEQCSPGDILVVAPPAPGSASFGYFGELLATSYEFTALKGLVIDGGVRDISSLIEKNFQVWAKEVCIRGTIKEILGSVNIPITCAGQMVNPGDLIVADSDGVVVVPRANAAAILKKSQEREAAEVSKREQFGQGKLGLDIYGMRPKLQALGLRYVDHAKPSKVR